MKTKRHCFTLAFGIVALGACSPEPRSTSYFETNDAERAEVLADCKAGTHRGEECNNAETARAQAQHKQSMEEFKHGF